MLFETPQQIWNIFLSLKLLAHNRNKMDFIPNTSKAKRQVTLSYAEKNVRSDSIRSEKRYQIWTKYPHQLADNHYATPYRLTYTHSVYEARTQPHIGWRTLGILNHRTIKTRTVAIHSHTQSRAAIGVSSADTHTHTHTPSVWVRGMSVRVTNDQTFSWPYKAMF